MVTVETKEQLRFTPNTLVVGASGFIGSKLIDIASQLGDKILTPGTAELNILEPESLNAYFNSHETSICINLAAHTNLEEGELERGDKSGKVWNINVNGVRNLLDATKEHGIFLIHISTDAVFPGTDKFPGPYSEEKEPPDDLEPLSWYGYTKLKGEQLVRKVSNGAVVRLAYPFGNPNSERDFVIRTLTYIQKGYSLFNDQYFTPTHISSLYELLTLLSRTKRAGVYHATCHGLTTPYDFANVLAEKLDIKETTKAGSVREFLKKPSSVPRLIRGGLLTKVTEQSLTISFPTWQEALDEYLSENS